jgi:hypothetical protein
MAIANKSLTLQLSKLKKSGLDAFRKLVSAAPGIDIGTLEQRVLQLAGGADTAELVHGTKVPLFPEIKTRQETAELVVQILDNAGINAGPSSGHESLFAWLALVFLPALCKRTSSGTVDTGQMYRYIPTRSTSDFYRHLVACPYWLLRQHGKSSRIFLSQPAYVMPDVVEQIASRPALIDSSGVVEVIDRCYWDESRHAPKSGFTTTKRIASPPPGYAKSSPAPGTLRALEWTLGQLQCTHDLRSMTADDIISKLPNEFQPWLNGNSTPNG